MQTSIAKKAPKEIKINPAVRFGQPTIDGTRVTVADVLNLIKAGYTVNDIPKQYPGVTLGGTVSALDYAANVLGNEEILAVS